VIAANAGKTTLNKNIAIPQNSCVNSPFCYCDAAENAIISGVFPCLVDLFLKVGKADETPYER
jgi:hypothetical protein